MDAYFTEGARIGDHDTLVRLAEDVGLDGTAVLDGDAYAQEVREDIETAREIANKSPDAVRAAKRLLNDAVTVDPAAGLLAESVEQEKLIRTPNQVEAVMSNLQKRAANYKD